MNEQNNINLVKELYRYFLSGDLSGMLNHVSDDAVLKQPPMGPQPFSGTYRGKEGITNFFSKVYEAAEFTGFEPKEFYANDNTVVVLGHYKAKSKIDGKEWESDMAEVWRIENNKAVEFQIHKDSALELLTLSKK